MILSDAPFYAPLKNSLRLTKGSGNQAFNRATLATVFDNENKLLTFPNNAARFSGARSIFNRIGSSPVLVTQNITTANDTYTLSFKGTGSVTISGTYSGSLSGTGVSNRVQLTFTATAGTLTLTPSGTVTEAQLELVTGQSDQTASEYIDTSLIRYDVVSSPLDLTVAPWGSTNGAVTANAHTNPIDGLQNSGNFIPTIAASVQHFVGQNVTFNGQVNGNAMTVYVKLTSAIDKVAILVGTGTDYIARFNLTTVTATTLANVYSAKITALGNNWFKLEAVFNSTITGTFVRMYVSSGAVGDSFTTEDGVSGIGIYLPSAGPVDCIKHYTTNKDGSAISNANLLGCLLNSGARTNNLLWCRDLTNAAWVKTNSTAALNQLGIDGKVNACSLITASAVDATVLQTITAAATAACSSFYVKRSAGSGSVYFTRDGGVSWTDITSLINSSTFTRVKIENTSVTNPQVGFKIAASGDAIIVDYGQNEAGLQVSMPILTTSAAATRNADSLTYQTASNFSDTAGTIAATVKRDDWSASNGSAVGSSTTGLHTRGGTSGAQALDGTNTVLGPTGTPTGQNKLACRYSGVTLVVAANGVIGTNGSYDGSFNLANIALMSGTNGYIRDVAIWQTAISDNDLISVTSIDIAGHIAKLIASSVSCRLLKLSAYNGKGATQFIQLHDAASLPADGSVPKVTLIMQSKSNIKLGYDLAGRHFENGIVICNSLTQETLTLGNNDLLIEEPIIEPAMH